MSGVYGKTKDYFAITSIKHDAENDRYYLSTKSSDYNYESEIEIEIIGSKNLKEKAFKAVTTFVDKNFEGIEIDLTRKIIISISDDEQVIRNV